MRRFKLEKRALNLAQALKNLGVGKRLSKEHANLGAVAVTRTEDGAEIVFEHGMVIITNCPIWELYLAETLTKHEKVTNVTNYLRYIAKKCLVRGDDQPVEVENKDFFLYCILKRKNPLISAIIERE
jgi:hypothetical protein